MSLGKELVKIAVLFVIGIPFFFIGGPVLFPLLYLFWKYIKLCIKVDIFVIYFIIRIPLWLFIQLPLWAFGRGVQKVQNFLDHALNFLSRKRKTAIAIITLVFLLFFFFFPLDFAGFSNISIGNVYGNVVALGMISVIVLTISMIIFAIIDTFGGGSIARRESPDMLGRGPAEGAKEAARHGREWAEKADKAKGVYDDLREVKSGGSDSPFAMLSDLSDRARALKMDFANINTPGGKQAAKNAARTAMANPWGAALIGIILLAIVVFVVQLVIVVLYFFSVAQFWLPIVGGSLMGAVGLGQDYGEYIGNTAADRYLAGVQVNIGLEDEIDAVREARQRVYCLLEGPACLRQWRLNNTQRPGTESVGETYGLQISGFSAGSGDQIDVGYRTGSYQLPISFRLSNTRHGLKGIDAKDVSYRVKVIDFDRGRNDPFCSTGWQDVDAYDVDGDGEENDLYPGTSAATGFVTLGNLTLENCGLLQPGAGTFKTVLLEVKYDYFSQATLYIQAMARQTLTSDPSIEQTYEPSQTADTPVKSILNAPSPVLYDQESLEAQPFTVRASLKTEEGNVEYKVRDLVVTKSNQMEAFQNLPSRNCQFQKIEDSENRLKPKSGDESNGESSTPDILAGEDDDRWYSEDNNPAFFGCPMNLTNPSTISPTGETLTMGVESNYTVRLNDQLGQFEVLNSRCSTLNCPLLVTLQYSDTRDDKDNWRHRCEGTDASDGCEVVQGRPDDWDNPIFMTGTDEDSRLDDKLEQGEVAIDPVRADYITTAEGGENDISYDDREVAVGLTDSQIEQIQVGDVSDNGWALVSGEEDGERETELIGLDYKLCASSQQDISNPRQVYKRYTLAQEEADTMISFNPVEADCEFESSGGPNPGPDPSDLTCDGVRVDDFYSSCIMQEYMDGGSEESSETDGSGDSSDTDSGSSDTESSTEPEPWDGE